jgi:hypothetical protein
MDPDNPIFGPDNSKMRSLFIGPLCRVFEGDGGGDDGGGGGAVSVVDTEGNFTENWAESYDEADRPTLSRFKTFPDFVKSHMDLRRKFNKDPDSLVEMPGKDSSDEVRAEFHKRRGVPEKAEEYEYKRADTLSDNIDIAAERMTEFSQIAKNHNLTPAQYNGVVNDYLALVDKDIAAQDLVDQEANIEANRKAEAALAKKFGKAKLERVARANAIMRHYGGSEAVAAMKLENEPRMVMFIDAIAEDMSEDRIRGITKTTVPTNEAINAKMNELRKHPAYYDNQHPEHREIMEQRKQLSLSRTA